MKTIKIRRIEQGAPRVNTAFIAAKDRKMIAIHVDLRSKHCEAHAMSTDKNETPCISITATECSINLQPGKDKDDDTIISFPEFKGYKAFAAGWAGKYTINVVLIKHGK